MEYCLTLIALLSVTLACKNCFNEDCDKWGICNQGCVAGFFGRECIDKCPTNCIGSICHLDENGRGVCTIGCSPGFFGLTCRAPCLSTNADKCDRHTGKPPVCDGSKYGSRCEQNCSCSGKSCDNEGTCLESCGNGPFGLQCDQQCPSNCRMCQQQSGDCILCKDGFYGDECQHTCATAISPLQRSKYKSVPGCSIIITMEDTAADHSLLIILACISCVMFLTLTLFIWIGRRKYFQRCTENCTTINDSTEQERLDMLM